MATLEPKDKKAKEAKDEKRKLPEANDDLTKALEDSFPASDPPSMTQPSAGSGRKPGKPRRSR